MSVYTIPASSSPWEGNESGSYDYSLNKVHYAGNSTNGAYYTWCAATAGSCSDAISSGAIASYSICPRGWRLPSLSEYQDFLNKAGIGNSGAGSMKIQGAPYNFQLAGNVGNGYLDFVGSNGYYWSSTAYDSNSAYNLYFSSNVVDTYTNLRFSGFSVRCIAP